jgi:hypothetical protein
VVQWSLKDHDLFCSYCFFSLWHLLWCSRGLFQLLPQKLKTNTSHNDRALSVTIHTEESGKRYWFSLFLLIKSKNYILLTELAKTFFSCSTLGQTGTGVLSDPGARVAQWVRSLDLTAHTSLSPIRRGFAPGFVNYQKKGALDSQPQVIKLTSCLPMVGGSLRVLRLPPPLKPVAMI